MGHDSDSISRRLQTDFHCAVADGFRMGDHTGTIEVASPVLIASDR